jgi:hypothetical protein
MAVTAAAEHVVLDQDEAATVAASGEEIEPRRSLPRDEKRDSFADEDRDDVKEEVVERTVVEE